jgi:hypothetical protein
MSSGFKEAAKIAFRAFIKGVTGFIIVPADIFVSKAKPGFEKASWLVKIYTGLLLVPLIGFLFVAAPWWEDFEIDD